MSNEDEEKQDLDPEGNADEEKQDLVPEGNADEEKQDVNQEGNEDQEKQDLDQEGNEDKEKQEVNQEGNEGQEKQDVNQEGNEDKEKQDVNQEGNEGQEKEDLNQEGNEDQEKQDLGQEGNEDNENNPEQSEGLNQEVNEESPEGTVTDNTMDSKPLLSRKTGKPLQHGFNQTSLIWEKRPLAEILGGRPAQLSPEVQGGDKKEAKPSYHDYFQGTAQVQTVTESDSVAMLTEEEAGQHPAAQLPRGESIVSIERRVPAGQMPSEWQKKRDSKLGVTSIWINQRLCAEFKSSGNQTSFIWDGKPLAQYLKQQREGLNPDILLQIEIQELFQRWPSEWPSCYDY